MPEPLKDPSYERPLKCRALRRVGLLNPLCYKFLLRNSHIMMSVDLTNYNRIAGEILSCQ
jgi:hypothetical protein